jgi:hypothetical protein
MIKYFIIFTLILFALMFIFPLMFYLNVYKYKKAALGLLISQKTQSIRTIKFFAFAMILYVISMFILILVDIFPVALLSIIFVIVSTILAITLIYVYYKLYTITRIR